MTNDDQLRKELYTILDAVPHEVGRLKQALIEDKVDGTMYSRGRHSPGCLIGTICTVPQSRALQTKIDDDMRLGKGVKIVTPAGSFTAHPDSALERFVFDIFRTCELHSDETRTAVLARRMLLIEWIDKWERTRKPKALARYKAGLRKWRARQRLVVNGFVMIAYDEAATHFGP